MAPIAREVAWRVFAGEYNAARHTIHGEGDRAPNYQLSPLGARINRLYLVGVLTSTENVGTEAEPLWRGRVSDPTGVFYLSAGQFDPGAAKTLSELEPPIFVAVIGKARAYSPEEGTTLLSVRPEVIKPVGEPERDAWIMEACRSTLGRVTAMAEAMQLEEPDPGKLASLGVDGDLCASVIEALDVYGPQDVERFRRMVGETLYTLSGREAGGTTSFPEVFPTGPGGPSPPKEETGSGTDEPPARPADGPAEPDHTSGDPPPSGGDDGGDDTKNRLLDVITDLDTEEKGAPYNDILDTCAKAGMQRGDVDELINVMLIDGEICEPVLGRIRKV